MKKAVEIIKIKFGMYREKCFSNNVVEKSINRKEVINKRMAIF